MKLKDLPKDVQELAKEYKKEHNHWPWEEKKKVKCKRCLLEYERWFNYIMNGEKK